jgi:uncharacterized delta-60 repeat protein
MQNLWVKLAATLPPLLLIATEVRAQSALDGFDPGANDGVFALATQADGKLLVGGLFTTLGGGGTGTITRSRIGRLNADSTTDPTFDPGANNLVDAVAVQADGKIIVGGLFTMLGGGGTGTTPRNFIGRLNPDGTLDTSFNPGANGRVNAIAVQADGKILVGGAFTTLGGGGTGTTARNFIGRLNLDGTLDTTFDPGANNTVFALAVQADSRIVIGGSFTMLGGGGTGTTTRNRIGRLLPNGTLDAGFNPGANNSVFALAVQADSRILVGGNFSALGGGGIGTSTRNSIGRLNADGTLDTGFNPGANSVVNSLAVQADGKILVGGAFGMLGGGGTGTTTRNKIGRLNPDGALDTGFDPGANNTVLALVEQADGKIVTGGIFITLGGGGTGTTARNKIGRLYPDGTLDATLDPGANNTVETLAVQPDGKILVGGAFTMLGGGGSGIIARSRIGRLNPDGTLDTSFDPGANLPVNALAVQTDGKILVGGTFTGLGGGTGTTLRNRIGRLNADGTLDTSFNPGANNEVTALAVQADGKILVGGTFTTLGGGGAGTTARNAIGRLNANGSLDTSFDPGASGDVNSLAVQADGKILVGGGFTTLGGGGSGTTARNTIGRLNSNGTLDASFDPGANATVNALAVQADGKILVGGFFTMLGGGGTGTTPRSRIGRLNADGTLDASFDPGAGSAIHTLALQADGKILVGGQFIFLGGGGVGTTARSKIGRLNPDGTLDTSFDPGANFTVNALAVQADGKILAGGTFTIFGDGTTTSRVRLGRLTNTVPAFQRLAVDTNGTTITWNRSSASPEVDRVSFESSTDGINYDPPASAIRAVGGWQLTGQSLPTHQNLFIRARGYYSTGQFDGSGSIVESVRNVFISPPPIALQIISRKTHGVAGTFGIALPLTGTPGIECRTGGANGDHRIVLSFAGAASFISAAVTSGTGSVASVTSSGNPLAVDLTGVANAQRIIVTLFGLSDGTNTGNLDIPMAVLLGDTNGNGSVNAGDIAQTKAQSGQTTTAANFRTDANVSGTISAADIALVKSKSGTSLPP